MGPKKHPLQTYQDQIRDGVQCACGRVMSVRSTRCRWCAHRAAQARYRVTQKGKATTRRYNHGAARKSAHARYAATERWQHANTINNGKRIFIGRRYHGHAQTVEQAAAINARVKERVSAFITRQQARAEAKGASARTVPA